MSTKVVPYSKVLVALLKGPVYVEEGEIWETLLSYESPVRDYFARIGIEVLVDLKDGFAFLKSEGSDEAEDVTVLQSSATQKEAKPEVLPRLIVKRALSYEVTLLCVLLREALMEFDYGGTADQRLVLKVSDLHEMLSPYFEVVKNEARRSDQFDSLIRKIEQMGFLRRIGNGEHFEVMRILKARVPAEALREIKDKLEKYHAERLV